MPSDILSAEATWQQLSCSGTLPPPRYGHSATIVGQSMIVFGGQDGKQQFNDIWVLEIIDPWTWTSVPSCGPSPAVRTRHTATCVGDTIIVYGGFSRETRYLSDMHTLTLAGEPGQQEAVWTSLDFAGQETMGKRAQHAAAATSDGRHVVIFGGYDGTKNLQDVWVVSMADERVSSVPCSAMPDARSRHSMHVLADKLHVFGGYDGSKVYPGDVFALDVDDPSRLMHAAGDDDDAEGGAKDEDGEPADQGARGAE